MVQGTYQGIILDFDGTLADSEPLYYEANRRAFLEFGHDIDEMEYYHHWSLLGEGSAGEIRRHGLTSVNPRRVRELSRRFYRELVARKPVPLLPGARELLVRLPASGLRPVIASNTDRALIESILDGNGLTGLPVPIIGGDGLPPKPAPDIFLRARAFLDLPEDRCIILEDTDKGVRAARAAGIPFAVIHSPLYPEYAPGDAIAKFPDLYAFTDFLLGQTLA
ncbi:MAG TPA: HAD family phosphatase [bacterium]|nr:HAD family phosphatase [bacterium]